MFEADHDGAVDVVACRQPFVNPLDHAWPSCNTELVGYDSYGCVAMSPLLTCQREGFNYDQAGY